MTKHMLPILLTCLSLLSCSTEIKHATQHCTIMQVDSDYAELLPVFKDFATKIDGDLRPFETSGVISVYEDIFLSPHTFTAKYSDFIGGERNLLTTKFYTNGDAELENKFFTHISKHAEIMAYTGKTSLCDIQKNTWDKNVTSLPVKPVLD